MDSNLFKAILSMDAYNRGYGAGINLTGTQTGNGTIVIDSSNVALNLNDQAIGFYGIAYLLPSGEKVISYRGTDNPPTLLLPLTDDFVNGWSLGAGNINSEQGQMAIQFYQSVAGSGNWLNANISLTGHSLGGGLAGLVAGLYDQDARLFDSMDYAVSLANIYTVTHLDQSDPDYRSDLKTLIYGSAAAWGIDVNGIQATHINGEALGFVRLNPSVGIDLGNDVTGLTDADLHSISTLIIRQFADTEIGSVTDWRAAAQYFWPVMYDNAFAASIGMTNPLVNGVLQAQEKYADILRQTIAYSAIDEGTRIFGDTGIRALYNDANELGKILSISGSNSIVAEYATEISESFVQFGVQLALSKTLKTSDYDPVLNGVLSLSSDTSSLTIDFSQILWGKAGASSDTTNMIARADLMGKVIKDIGGGIDTSVRSAMQQLWGDPSTNVFDRVTFSVGNSLNSDLSAGDYTSGKAGVVIGGDTGNNIISGTNGNDLIIGGSGNDVLNGGKGDDILVGKGGTNSLSGGYGDDYFFVGSGTTHIDGGSGFDTLDLSIFGDVSLNVTKGTYSGANGSVQGDFSSLGKIILDGNSDNSLYAEYGASNPQSPTNLVVNGGTVLSNDDLEVNGVKTIYLNATGDFVYAEVAVEELGMSYVATGDYRYNLNYSSLDHSITYNNMSGTVISGGGETDYISGRVNLIGTDMGDTFYLGNYFDTVWTGRGNDIINIDDKSTYHYSEAGYLASSGTIVYTGGNDFLLGGSGGRRFELLFSSEIRPEDIMFIEEGLTVRSTSEEDGGTNSTRFISYNFDLIISVSGYGTITIPKLIKTIVAGVDETFDTNDDRISYLLPDLSNLSVSVIAGYGSMPYKLHFSNGDYINLDASTGKKFQDLVGQHSADFGKTYSPFEDNVQVTAELYNGGGGNDILTGSAGRDILEGGSGNDILYGLGENDSLAGGDGDDHLYGGDGDNGMSGGTGNDTYFITDGGSYNTISDSGGDNDVIMFGAGITYSMLRFESPENIMIGTGGSIYIMEAGEGQGSVIEYLKFSDGTVFDLRKGLNITGTSSSEGLYGTNFDDTLNGKGGGDYIEGGTGNDTYIFDVQDGNQILGTVIDANGDNDTIFINLDISSSDIYFQQSGPALFTGLPTGDLGVFFGGALRITIQNHFSVSSNPDFDGTGRIEKLVLADGTTYDLTGDLPYLPFSSSNTFYGTSSADYLVGSSSDDFIQGYGGDDTLIAGAGDDTFNGGDGVDTVIYSAGYDSHTIGGVETLTVADNLSNGGIDTLSHVEKLIFSDGIYQDGVFTLYSSSGGGGVSNTTPVLGADNATLNANSLVNIDVLANDTDANGDVLSVVSVTAPAHGTVVINANNTVTYTPTSNYTGADSFTYTVSDGHDGTATQTVSIIINPASGPNTSPAAGKDNVSVNQNGSVAVNVLANDSDPDGDALVVSSVDDPDHGMVVINSDNTVTYTPTAGYYGDDTFYYTISDGRGGEATQRVNVTVNQVSGSNAAPVAGADTATVGLNGSVAIAVLANDTDANGDALSVSSVTAPAHGTAVINANNTVTYTPTTNYSGADSFTYTVSDGHGGTATQTVSVTVTSAANTAPVLGKDNVSVNQNASVVVSVLANDSDADGDPLTVSSVDNPAHGTVTLNANNTVTYTPTAGYYGDDTFYYSVSDGRGGAATQRVNVTVNQVTSSNVAPVAVADSATVAKNSSVAISVLANDTDANGDTLSVASVTAPAHGTAVINANNTVTYTPTSNYTGADSFTYTVSDGHGGTATQTVSLTVNDVTNTAPVLGKDNVSTNEDQPITISVLSNDSDANGDKLTVTSLSAPGHGTAIINANNTVTYTPEADYYGDDTFYYTVSDGHGGEATQRINVSIASVADATIEGTNSGETLNGTSSGESIAGLGGADTINAGGGNDTLYGGYGADILYGQGGADTFVFDKNSAFSAVDTIKDFSTSQSDKIDIKDLLVGYDSVTSAITNFVEITTSGSNSILKVDRDGVGTTYGWQQIATIEGVTGLTDEAALKASGNLIVA